MEISMLQASNANLLIHFWLWICGKWPRQGIMLMKVSAMRSHLKYVAVATR